MFKMKGIEYFKDKKKAWYFYRYLSIIYDIINPFFYTQKMKMLLIKMADLNKDHKVVEVGSGTGYTTQGIITKVKPENIMTLDQSEYQHAKAIKKRNIRDIDFVFGDSENLPFKDNEFDRYISAGSIEYWPDPLKAIREGKRVVKKGGKVLIIGPIKPKLQPFKYFWETVMLFPTTKEYVDWYKEAGLKNVEYKLCRPPWFFNDYAIVISGVV